MQPALTEVRKESHQINPQRAWLVASAHRRVPTDEGPIDNAADGNCTEKIVTCSGHVARRFQSQGLFWGSPIVAALRSQYQLLPF